MPFIPRVRAVSYTHLDVYKRQEFDVNLDRINVLLGTDFQQEEVMKVLDDLHLEPSVNHSDIHVKIPSYRMDLAIEADIAEEMCIRDRI